MLNTHYIVAMIFVILAILVCAYESLTKGWFIFYMIPLAVIAFPLTLTLQGLSFRYQSRLADPAQLIKMRNIQIGALLALYVFTPGVGDTSEVLLFGFYSTDSTALIGMSMVLAWLAAIAALYATIRLFYAVVMAGKLPAKQSQPKLTNP